MKTSAYDRSIAKFTAVVAVIGLLLASSSCSQNEHYEASSTTSTTVAEKDGVTPTPIPACPEQVVISSGDITFGQIIDNYYLVDCEHMDAIDLVYNIQPRDVNIAIEEWASSDENVATVNSDGRLTPVGFGECEITLHVSDGLTDGAYTSINVVVEDGIIEMEDFELPDYYTLQENCLAVYGSDVIYVTSDAFSHVNDLEDYPFIGCQYYTSDFYADYPFEELVNGMNAPYIICRNDECSMFFYEDGLMVLCDEYILIIGTQFDGSTIQDVASNIGLPLPEDEEILSVLS